LISKKQPEKTREELIARFRQVIAVPVPLPGAGNTAERHHRLFEVAREDLSLARLVEAHWDAHAILAEAGHSIVEGALYGVWAAEAPDKLLRIEASAVSGSKPFCSGAGILDHALVTVKSPAPLLIDIDLKQSADTLHFDSAAWKTTAFAETNTSMATFDAVAIEPTDIVGEEDFYLRRTGFWHGACGPAACWAGGAAGLLDWAIKQKRDDPHTLAHLGAMKAAVWTMESSLQVAGQQIDATWQDLDAARARALILRHTVEQSCTDILRRLARAYGPHPLAMDEAISKRYQELDLYVRQSHAERDLAALGEVVHRQG
jgi:alkylation response protein AidB-like acyl-CoA dehydrogenase